jgi:hypothetical protein
LDEPAFSVAYAQMCRILQMKKVGHFYAVSWIQIR